MGIGILIGMLVGIIAWEIGGAILVKIQKRHGCFDYCYHCGKPPFKED